MSVLPILIDIFNKKQPEDKIVLDNGHSALALYCVLEAYEGLNAEKILDHHSIHPDRCEECHLDASTGSLGHGIGISIGMAIVDPDRTIHCVVSDGSCQEGSTFEGLRIKHDLGLKNLKIYCNFNGFTATSNVNREKLAWQMKEFCPDIIVYNTSNGEGFEGVQGHYKTL